MKKGAEIKDKRYGLVAKSQVTVFVIIAIIIVAAVALVFMFSSKKAAEEAVSPLKNPQVYAAGCVREQAENLINRIYFNGLLMYPENPIIAGSANISILCFTPNYNELCAVKHPLLIAEAERDMKNSLKISSEKCFEELKNSFIEGYNAGDSEIDVSILKDKVEVKIRKKVELKNAGQAFTYDNFNSVFASELYDFMKITNQILNEELNCDCAQENCYPDTLGISFDNPGYSINKTSIGDGRVAYTIVDSISNKKSTFAVRNCIWNPAIL